MQPERFYHERFNIYIPLDIFQTSDKKITLFFPFQYSIESWQCTRMYYILNKNIWNLPPSRISFYVDCIMKRPYTLVWHFSSFHVSYSTSKQLLKYLHIYLPFKLLLYDRPLFPSINFQSSYWRFSI